MNENNKLYEECLLNRRFNSQQAPKKGNSRLKGPLRVVRLCCLGILLPCFLVALILYLRYKVYVEQLYPLAMSDMRMLDNRISTLWCQRQLVKTNATYNAFLLAQPPTISLKSKPMSMVRQLELEDDTKEYWGFYLLRGSIVTLSTCVRWPGASLIVIRGHKHLHECAYIGDNSSEELDELMEAIREGAYKVQNETLKELEEDDDAPSNTPQMMKRHREDVQFYSPNHNKTYNTNHTLEEEELDTTDLTDSKTLKRILEILNLKAKKTTTTSTTKKPHMHIHRNSTIGRGEQDNLQFKKEKLPINSEEVLNDLYQKLQSFGPKGSAMLEKLNDKFRDNPKEPIQYSPEPSINIRGRQFVKNTVNFDDNIDRARRRKRELILQTAMLADFNQDDEGQNFAVEEGYKPDGIADHHDVINETTLNDKSNSEFWSSFSSSEEALLNCAGLILNLPLTPHTKCKRDHSEVDIEPAYLLNRISYKVPTNGYYFFVFNSENEVQKNYVRVNFHIEKTVYNVTNPIARCWNSTDQCAMDLDFFSNEKLVMELPVRDNEDLWNQEYVVVSVCEPRTVMYIAFVIAVPILVILFAFQ